MSKAYSEGNKWNTEQKELENSRKDAQPGGTCKAPVYRENRLLMGLQ